MAETLKCTRVACKNEHKENWERSCISNGLDTRYVQLRRDPGLGQVSILRRTWQSDGAGWCGWCLVCRLVAVVRSAALVGGGDGDLVILWL